jgi:hypothetical protein
MLIALACGAVLEQPGVIWIDGASLGGDAVRISDAGEYAVWAKTAKGGPGSVALGDVALSVQTFDTIPATRSGWVSLGSHTLADGETKLDVSGPIVYVVLAMTAEFDPLSAEQFMYVGDSMRDSPDGRLNRDRDTDTEFAMTEFDSLEEWEPFARDLRRKLLVGSGLWPLPDRTPLNTHVEDVAEYDDYIVSRVHFEATPGFFVTGNLFRPTGPGPFPGVVSPHGHWDRGRLEHGEQGSIPARGITLARMGMVAFTYDMLGYNDSQQIHHRFGDLLEVERNRLELWGIHPFALQLWSSIRAVDFLQALPYVDADNIACTGASGGGTQTFALTAVDDRVKVAAPVNMISHSMQGGCICENAPLIRFNASNMEVGALAAPRPMMMISASGDWTKKTPEVEYPAIRGIYEVYGEADRVVNVHIDAPHNYNQDSREAVYRFFGKWVLGEGSKWANFSEPETIPEPDEKARVFTENTDHEAGGHVLEQMIAERRERSLAALPKSPNGVEEFQREYGAALYDVTGVTKPLGSSVESPILASLSHSRHHIDQMILMSGDASTPATLYRPFGDIRGCALVVHADGKAALVDIAQGEPGALVSQLLGNGIAVLTIDVFQTGEHPLYNNERTNGRFPTTFLPTDTGYRIQDIVTALTYLRSLSHVGDVTALIGLGDAGVWSLFASALDGEVPTTIVDTNGFDPDDDEQWMTKHYLACVRSVGDVQTAAAMVAPRTLVVFNTRGRFDLSSVASAFGDSLVLAEDDWSVDQIVGGL